MTAPWNSGLPTALMVGGEEQPIRTDYRVALDCFLALTDPELDEYNKLLEVVEMVYINDIDPDYLQEAIEQAFWFLRGGEEDRGEKGPQLVAWEQDFQYIASPISTIVGKDIRGMEYLHWWTFLSAYMAIGDCMFAQIVRIRDMKARGKRLDKSDREFYRKNRTLIDIKTKYTDTEQNIFKEWM